MVTKKEETRWEKGCSWTRWVARLEEKQGGDMVNELNLVAKSGPGGTRRWRGRMSLPSSSSIPPTLIDIKGWLSLVFFWLKTLESYG
ncbi:hypothetical protein QVD17_15361 [Tagetes erecta]|uniref:Uncharacterized protein n=1 Tax=Tagetes erecta TaxID=13708 RepID=A0AAD8KS83_TARER|nr:hypothetical protein QVD17_15361 [Tagetes erecta]